MKKPTSDDVLAILALGTVCLIVLIVLVVKSAAWWRIAFGNCTP